MKEKNYIRYSYSNLHRCNFLDWGCCLSSPITCLDNTSCYDDFFSVSWSVDAVIKIVQYLKQRKQSE